MAVSYSLSQICFVSDFLFKELLNKIRSRQEYDFDAEMVLQEWITNNPQAVLQQDLTSFISEVLAMFQTDVVVRDLVKYVQVVGNKMTWEKPEIKPGPATSSEEIARSWPQPLRSIIYCEGKPCNHCDEEEGSDACQNCLHG